MKKISEIIKEDKKDTEILMNDVNSFEELNVKLKVMQESSKRVGLLISFIVFFLVLLSLICGSLMQDVKDLKEWKVQVEKVDVDSNINK